MIRLPFSTVALGLSATLGLTTAASGQVVDAFFDFEAPGFDSTDPGAIGAAGFDFFFSSTGGVPGFDDFSGFIAGAPALTPNEAPTILTPAVGDAALAGDTSIVFFTDVNSGLFQDDPAVNEDPRILQLNVFQQQIITADDIGVSVVYDFLFSGAEGALNTEDSTTVEAFLLTLDPNNGFATTNEVAFDLSGGVVGLTEAGQLSLDLTAPELEGQILQFGFRNSAADFQNPAVILDNLSLTVVPEPASLALLGLGGILLAGRRRTA